MNNDGFRTALISFLQSIFPVIVLSGVAAMSDQLIGAIMLLITNGITLLMLFWKSGQQPDPAVLNAAVDARVKALLASGQLRAI